MFPSQLYVMRLSFRWRLNSEESVPCNSILYFTLTARQLNPNFILLNLILICRQSNIFKCGTDCTTVNRILRHYKFTCRRWVYILPSPVDDILIACYTHTSTAHNSFTKQTSIYKAWLRRKFAYCSSIVAWRQFVAYTLPHSSLEQRTYSVSFARRPA